MYKLSRANQKGQALLIILLVLAVSLTLVLSTASKSITDVATSTLEEESIRAFNAAEAGVEKALIDGTIGTFTGDFPDSNSSYGGEVTFYEPSNGTSFAHPESIMSGESVTVWFASHDADGDLVCTDGECLRANNIRVCFGEVGTNRNAADAPAIEISIYYDTAKTFLNGGSASGIRVSRAAYDPNTAGRRATNNFSLAQASGCTITTDGVQNSYQFNVGQLNLGSAFNIPGNCHNQSQCLIMARIRSLYNTSKPNPIGIIVNPVLNSSLPPQGIVVDSSGDAGDAIRKIKVKQTYPELPFIFDASIYTNSPLQKS